MDPSDFTSAPGATMEGLVAEKCRQLSDYARYLNKLAREAEDMGIKPRLVVRDNRIYIVVRDNRIYIEA